MQIPKYAYIDVMRGLAIILVVITHTSQSVGLPKGPVFGLTQFCQFGVQMFFVASALTLSLSMSKRGASGPEVKNFYLRRLWRIAPLYYAGIAFYFLLSLLAAQSAQAHGLSYTPLNVAANAFFLHGLYEPANNAVVPGGWSIGCEMLFYALFPLLFRVISTPRRALAFVVGSFTLNILAQLVLERVFHYPLRNNGFRYFFLTTQLPVFGCGRLLYFVLREPMNRAKSWLVWAGAFVSLLVAFALWHEVDRFPGGILVLPTVVGGFCALLGCALSRAELSSALARGVASVGQKSFSIYIFHFVFAWNLTGALTGFLSAHHIGKPLLYLPVMIALTLALSYGVALFTYRFIEEAGIKVGKRVEARD